MKNIFLLVFFLPSILFFGCRNKEIIKPDDPNKENKYNSLAEFHAKYEPKMKTVIMDAATGGTFTTEQGTKVVICPNAFLHLNYSTVTGDVQIDFKDIYKRSDMFWSNKPASFLSNDNSGLPLKSAGEFYIKASQNGEALQVGTSADDTLLVIQPLFDAYDAFIHPYGEMVHNDTVFLWGWNVAQGDNIMPLSDTIGNAIGYIYTIYYFQNPINGSWLNSDCDLPMGTVFTTLSMHPSFSSSDFDEVEMFFILSDVRSTAHLYKDYNSGDFIYNHAPFGYNATVVALGLKDGNLYSSFTPVTITNNLTVDFGLQQTTDVQFKAAIEALN